MSGSPISMDKKYRTKDGHAVRILATDINHPIYPVAAVVLCGDGQIGDCPGSYTSYGKRYFAYPDFPGDLIEVCQRIQRECWVNVYGRPYDDAIHSSRKDADDQAVRPRLACVKITIDCEVGEGL